LPSAASGTKFGLLFVDVPTCHDDAIGGAGVSDIPHARKLRIVADAKPSCAIDAEAGVAAINNAIDKMAIHDVFICDNFTAIWD
jgi:hypothetical protein